MTISESISHCRDFCLCTNRDPCRLEVLGMEIRLSSFLIYAPYCLGAFTRATRALMCLICNAMYMISFMMHPVIGVNERLPVVKPRNSDPTIGTCQWEENDKMEQLGTGDHMVQIRYLFVAKKCYRDMRVSLPLWTFECISRAPVCIAPFFVVLNTGERTLRIPSSYVCSEGAAFNYQGNRVHMSPRLFFVLMPRSWRHPKNEGEQFLLHCIRVTEASVEACAAHCRALLLSIEFDSRHGVWSLILADLVVVIAFVTAVAPGTHTESES